MSDRSDLLQPIVAAWRAAGIPAADIASLCDDVLARFAALGIEPDATTIAELATLIARSCTAAGAANERGSLSDRVAAIQTLSTGFAHELRNPINAARLQLEMLERELRRSGDTAGPQVQRVQTIDHELDRVSRLLDEFLAFARPSKLVLGSHDVRSLVREVLESEKSLADARGVELAQPEVASTLARVDANKFRQMLRNLVRNAIEASEPGGRVSVAVELAPEHVYIDVDDDGPGVPESVRRRIYEPFFTTKDAGTGLGLSIVHNIASSHGGSVELHPKPRGTRFRVALPTASA